MAGRVRTRRRQGEDEEECKEEEGREVEDDHGNADPQLTAMETDPLIFRPSTRGLHGRART